MKNKFNYVLAVTALAGSVLFAACNSNGKKSNADSATATDDTSAKAAAALTLPEGFTANVLAENLGGTRHIAVSPQGDIFVKLGKTKDGKGIVVLHENNGKADVKTSFGDFGGTGIYLKNG